MFSKIIKTIFILNLCLAMTVYAGSVNVSDGSAFITKAEMAYTLNNLSNRMVQLENSLDSKIDGLVSSYLTRNGVWNGVKQTINKKKIRDYWRSMSGRGVSSDFNAVPAIPDPSQIVRGQQYNFRNQTWTLINKCTKGGLLVGSFTIQSGFDCAKEDGGSSASGTDGRNYFYILEPHEWVHNNIKCSNATEISLWVNGECRFYSIPINVGSFRQKDRRTAEESGNYRQGLLHFTPMFSIQNPMFFVDKGDEVKVKYVFGIIPQTQDTQECIRGACDTTSGYTSVHGLLVVGSAIGVGADFNDFYIY